MENKSKTSEVINYDPLRYYSYIRPEILELIPHDIQLLLDVGCGSGTLGAFLKDNRNIEVHGVELLKEAADRAGDILDRVWNSSIEDALQFVPEDHYDCIVAADVLEHLYDPWQVLTQLKSKLTSTGIIILSIPNIQNWGVLSELVKGKWDYTSEGILDRTHVRFFTRKSVEELCLYAKLKIISLNTTKRPPPPPAPLIRAFPNFLGICSDTLKEDGDTWQFLVKATQSNKQIKPRISIVVLNWNGLKDTIDCLNSIRIINYDNHQTIVVDNGSTDNSIEIISKEYPEVEIISSDINLGYSGGNNLGIQHALNNGADFVFLLNNDTIVHESILNELTTYAALDERIGILGPVNFFHDQPDIIWTVGANICTETHKGYQTFGEGDKLASWNSPLEFDAIIGSAMLIRRTVFEKIGFFDERFFLCFEELDFCERARKAQFKCLYIPEAKIWHKVGSSLGEQVSPLRIYFNTRNRALWAKKNLNTMAKFRLLKAHIKIVLDICWPKFTFARNTSFLKGALWGISTSIKTVKRNISNPVNIATLYGVIDYYLSRFGNCRHTLVK